MYTENMKVFCSTRILFKYFNVFIKLNLFVHLSGVSSIIIRCCIYYRVS